MIQHRTNVAYFQFSVFPLFYWRVIMESVWSATGKKHTQYWFPAIGFLECGRHTSFGFQHWLRWRTIMNIPFIYLIVYIYESGAYPNDTRINRETTTTNNNNKHRRARKKHDDERVSYIKDIGIALCFKYIIIFDFYLPFCYLGCSFNIQNTVYILFNFFFVVVDVLFLFMRRQSQFVNYRIKMHIAAPNHRPKKRSKQIWHGVISIIIRVFNHDYQTQT